MSEVFSREIVFEKLFMHLTNGNLVRFIGAGFSKAVIVDDFLPALGWFVLIREVSENFDIKFPDDADLIGVSYLP